MKKVMEFFGEKPIKLRRPIVVVQFYHLAADNHPLVLILDGPVAPGQNRQLQLLIFFFADNGDHLGKNIFKKLAVGF